MKRKKKKLYWVATYSDMGLEVSHYKLKREYETAVREAEEQHEQQELDSYTCGHEEV